MAGCADVEEAARAVLSQADRAVLNRFAAIGRAYRIHVREHGNEPSFLAALAFLVTFLLIRVLIHEIRAGEIGKDIVVGTLHIHHMVPGLALVLVSGLLDLAAVWPLPRAIAFGIGAALVLDEFALILNLADVYWAPQGRESIDAVVLFAVALIIVGLGGGFWHAAFVALRRRF